MKAFTLVCFFGLLAMAVSRPSDQYTDKYDNVNVDEILENDRVLKSYINCVLDQGKCAPDAKELKGHIAEALETDCAKCSDKHKTETRKVIKHLINHNAEAWDQLVAKYDPSRKYVTKYEKDLREAKA